MPGRILLLVRSGVEIDSSELPERRRVGLAEVDELARMLLAAKRLGLTITLRDPCPTLLAILDLVGLTDLSGLGIQSVRQPEQGEVLGSDEVVMPDDPIA